MLRYSLGEPEAADAIDRAVHGALEDRIMTPDLGGRATTEEATRTVTSRVAAEARV
jgi:isocitrate/isopropylmalate dehydrogenase